MYQLEFIETIVADAIDKIQHSKQLQRSITFSGKFDIDSYYRQLPDFNPIYKETIKKHDRIAIHSQGIFPYEILKSKAPNQSPDEWEYQQGLYEPYTSSAWNRAKNKTKIIANKQNYSITGWDEEQKTYFYADYPTYHSLVSYFFDIVRDAKIDFPNKLLVIKPLYIPGEWTEEGQFIVDQSELISPVAVIVDEERIICYKENDYALILSEDKSKYVINNKEKDGLIFEFYDKDSIWHIIQVGESDNNKPIFEFVEVYQHNWGYVPARKLGGKPVMIKDNMVLYDSWFADAVADLNDVIRLSSNLMMSTYKLAFPIIIAVVDHCNYQDENGNSCNGGKLFKDGKYVSCPSCNGTGKQSSHSPTGVYEIAATRGIGQDNNLPMSPPVQFAAPDSSILEYTKNQIEDKKKSAFSFIYETDEATSKTATGAQLEKEEFHSFLLHFSNELFDLLEFTIEGIGYMRYGDSFVTPQISRPQFFNFRTNSDITVEIGEAIKNNVPQPYIKQLVDESADTRFNSKKRASDETYWAMAIDRLWAKTTTEVRAMVGVTCTKAEAIVHDSFSTLLSEVIDEMGYDAFAELSLTDKKAKIFEKANVLAAQLVPPASNVVQSILNQ